ADPAGPGPVTGGSSRPGRDVGIALLLESRIPARIAWVGADHRPWLTPMWFVGRADQVTVVSFAGAKKLAALVVGTAVAVSVDTESFPYRRLTAEATVADVRPTTGLAPEYQEAAQRYLGADVAQRWLDHVGRDTDQVAIDLAVHRLRYSDMAIDSPFLNGTAETP
ncbi:MAG: pyridoxamine 5'-phosphate oxidase family protein, partial [Angustibacter sp.]